MAKYYLKKVKKLTLAHTKKRFKLVKQKIKNNLILNKIINKTKTLSKKIKFKNAIIAKKKYLKTKYFK